MVFSWVHKGLRTGVLTTRYPAVHEQMPEGFRGKPVLDPDRCLSEQGCTACVQICLPAALELKQEAPYSVRNDAAHLRSASSDCKEVVQSDEGGAGAGATQLTLDYGRCIMCGLCVQACPTGALQMTADYELAARHREDLQIVNLLEVSTEDGGTQDGGARFISPPREGEG